MIALRLNRRRDGSWCVTDVHSSSTSPDRAFPDVHGFSFRKLVELGEVVSLQGDRLTLTFANGRAVYRVTETIPTGLNLELVESELFDPPPIDEAKAAELAANRPAEDVMELTERSIARAGTILVDEEA